ncbi:hypothetical protein JHK86_024334 [Glycine max]|nr:hypothetical protein JHK86_024334 [Glycine max]
MQRHYTRQKSYRDIVRVTVCVRNPIGSLCRDTVRVRNPVETLGSATVRQESYRDTTCHCVHLESYQITRDMTLNALKRQIQQKMGLNQGQSIMTVIYRYTVTVGSSMFIYQAVTINEDEDIDSMFDVDNRHECISFFELLIQYEQQSSSTTNVETTNPSSQIQQTQYTDYHTESQHEGLSS